MKLLIKKLSKTKKLLNMQLLCKRLQIIDLNMNIPIRKRQWKK
jgi:hypothetical protein